MKKITCLTLLAALLLYGSAWAKEITLSEAFKQIAGHYQVNFIYEDQTIAGKAVADVNLLKDRSIAKTLNRILPPLGLAWFNTDQQNYAVYPAVRAKSPAKPDDAMLNTTPADSLKTAVSGYIKEEHGHAQAFATVSLVKAADAVIVSNVLSDTSGFYRFTAVLPGSYKIKVAMVGYEPIYSADFLVSGQNKQVETLVMKPSVKTLNEVKITAARPLVERKVDRFILNVGWTMERTPFPPSYSPNVPYKGWEEIHFPPGWGNSKTDDYWTVSYLFRLDGHHQMNVAALQNFVNDYYNGLIADNVPRRHIPKEKLVPVSATLKKIKTDQGDLETYKGVISSLDYLAQVPIKLNCRIHLKPGGEHFTPVLIEVSPKPYEHPIWHQMAQTVVQFQCGINKAY